MSNVSVETYVASAFVRTFHKFPHVDFDFNKVTNTSGNYKPQDSAYYDSLAMIAAAFTVVGLVSFLVLLVATCGTMCCSRKLRNRGNNKCIRSSIAFFGIVMVCFAGVGIVGNFLVSKGVKTFITDTQDLDNYYAQVVNSVSSASRTAQQALTLANNLQQELSTESAPSDIMSKAQQIVIGLTNFEQTTASIASNAVQFDVSSVYHDVRVVDKYRSFAFYVGLGLFAFIGLLLTMGGYARSKCLLGTAVFLGLFLVILGGVMTGADFGASVGIADACVDPTTLILSEINTQDQRIKYYLYCTSDYPDPFESDFFTALNAILTAEQDLSSVATWQAQNGYGNATATSLLTTSGNLRQQVVALDAEMECPVAHNMYVDVLDGVCGNVMKWMVWMSGAQAALFIFLVMEIALVVCGWKYMSKADLRYENIDPERVPLIPAEGAINNGSDRSFASPARNTFSGRGPASSLSSYPSISQTTYDLMSANGSSSTPRSNSGVMNPPIALAPPPPVFTEGQDLRLQCKICFEYQIDRTMNPCGHTICHECLDAILQDTRRECPFCRRPISSNSQLYL